MADIRGEDLKHTLSAWLPRNHWPSGLAVIYAIRASDVETAHQIVNALPARAELDYKFPKPELPKLPDQRFMSVVRTTSNFGCFSTLGVRRAEHMR